MFINFAKKLFEDLVSDEFSYIKQESNTLVYETEALSLYKDKGSILYIVTIINGERLDKTGYDKIVEKYSGILDGANRAQVVLMNVIVNDYENVFEADEDFAPEKKSYIFTYNIELEKKRLTVKDGQPDLLRLEGIINHALESYDEAYINGTHLTSLQKDLENKYALPVKSNNSLLTFLLIGLNIALWLLIEATGSSGDAWTLISFGALTRDLVINQHEYYRLFTSMFIHIGILHLVNNCLALYIFGARVERHFGKLTFIIIYLAAGITGNLLTAYFIPNLSAGASGAIFGLLGTILSISYRTGRSVGNLSPYVIVLICVYTVGMGFVMPAVNNFAHIGGFVVGILFGSFIKLKADNTEPDFQQTRE